MLNKQRLICFYLPQYHPIKENDEWWGKGFTEWINVAKSKPRFKSHYQPHIPADLSFYDLRLEETRVQQAKLALSYGISGFCYYHYWFNGKMLLERPLNDFLQSGTPDFPFCLCWANENWTRAWDGLDREVLIQQNYTEEDSLAHIKWFLNCFRDSRYILVNGKPLLLIFRIDNIPNIEQMMKLWRNEAIKNGFDGLYICAMKTGFVDITEEEMSQMGFDALVDFHPNRNDFPSPRTFKSIVYEASRKYFPNKLYQWLKHNVESNKIVNYHQYVSKLKQKRWPTDYRLFPCVMPSWDNSARRKSATIIQNNDPEIYGDWLNNSIERVAQYSPDEQLVFINAWNEWAEGCHLEPDQKFGHEFLQITKKCIESVSKSSKND